MIQFLGLISSLILFFIGILHFYWAFGGKWAYEKVLPLKREGDRVINPNSYVTVLVGIVFIFFALIYVVEVRLIELKLPRIISDYGVKLLSLLFILRVTGDFKYIGFFKKIKNTTFAKNDTMLYTPLCLFLGIVAFLIQVYS